MKKFRMLAPLFALALAFLPASALASTVDNESVYGVETSFPTTCPGGTGSLSTFGGAATGSVNGVFQLAVCHGDLPTSSTTPGQIYGATFSITNASGTVSGTLGPGTISLGPSYRFDGVCLQQYEIAGGSKTSSYAGTLTHFAMAQGSGCGPVFFATVTGTASFTTG